MKNRYRPSKAFVIIENIILISGCLATIAIWGSLAFTF